MTALAVALSLWGLLAFVGFIEWMNRTKPAHSLHPVLSGEEWKRSLDDHEKRLADLTARVAGLSLAAGIRPARSGRGD